MVYQPYYGGGGGGGGGDMGGLGLLQSAMEAIYGKRMYDISKADWENLFELVTQPEIEHRRKVYWPIEEAIGSEVTRRMYEEPSKYFTAEAPYYERAKERIYRTYGEEERGLAQKYAQAGQVGRLPQVYKGLARERGRELTGFTKELAMREAERIPEEKARRIATAMGFISGQGGAPSVPLGAMPQPVGINWGNIVGGMAQDAGFWAGFISEMSRMKRGTESPYAKLGYGTQGTTLYEQLQPLGRREYYNWIEQKYGEPSGTYSW